MRIGARTTAAQPVVLFCLGLGALLAVEWFALASSPAMVGPDVIAFAATVDLLVGPAALTWILFVRIHRADATVLAPVLLASFVLASVVIPAFRHDTLDTLRPALAIVELVAVALIVGRTVRVWRSLERSGDLLTDLRRMGGERSPVIGAVLATEIASPYYALLGPFRRRPAGFAYGEGWGAIVLLFGMAIAVETVAVHVLVSLISSAAAWVATALSVYALVWLVADLQAARLRPIVIRGGELLLRTGLRWTCAVPIDTIRSADFVRGGASGDGLMLSLGPSSTMRLTLSEPARAFGPFGIVRRVTVICIDPIDPRALRQALVACGASLG